MDRNNPPAPLGVEACQVLSCRIGARGNAPLRDRRSALGFAPETMGKRRPAQHRGFPMIGPVCPSPLGCPTWIDLYGKDYSLSLIGTDPAADRLAVAAHCLRSHISPRTASVVPGPPQTTQIPHPSGAQPCPCSARAHERQTGYLTSVHTHPVQSSRHRHERTRFGGARLQHDPFTTLVSGDHSTSSKREES
jgi:hypothetical protein